MARQRLGLFIASAALAAVPVFADPLPPDASYRPLPTLPFGAVKANDEAAKPGVMQRQQRLLEQRYDPGDRPVPGQMMSGGRKPVQGGVRVKLPQGATWDSLAMMTADEIKQRGLLPEGFKPLPHVKHATGGQVFPNRQIDEIARQEQR